MPGFLQSGINTLKYPPTTHHNNLTGKAVSAASAKTIHCS